MAYIEWEPIIIVVVLSLGGFSALIVSMFLSYRRRQLMSAEILAAIEKGIDVPMVQEVKKPKNLKHRGILWSAIGVAIFFVALLASHEIEIAAWGLLPFAVGVAYLFIARDEEQKAAE